MVSTKIYGFLFIRILYFEIAASINECGLALEHRIIGGEETRPYEFPWMGALFLKEHPGDPDCNAYHTTNVACGATLITSRQLLTAAHCFTDVTLPSDILIRMGAHDLQEGEDFIPISFVVHKSFDAKTMANDIAIITLDRDVALMPICLPFGHVGHSFAGDMATVAGFGKISAAEGFIGCLSFVPCITADGPASSKLLKVKLQVVTNEQCTEAFSQMNYLIFSTAMCAGFVDGLKDACQGDSGGPLMLKIRNIWFLIGIVSFGYKCAEPGYFGVYTRITEFLDWIEGAAS